MTIYVIHTKANGSKNLRTYSGISAEEVTKLQTEYGDKFDVVDQKTFDEASDSQRKDMEAAEAAFRAARMA